MEAQLKKYYPENHNPDTILNNKLIDYYFVNINMGRYSDKILLMNYDDNGNGYVTIGSYMLHI